MESEVDYEKIKEILERYFGARWTVISVGKLDADRDKAVIFNVDICDYYFIILKYNIISQRFSVWKLSELCEN